MLASICQFSVFPPDGNVLVSCGCNSEEAEAASLFQNGVLCEDITASMQAMHPQLDASKAMACACEYNLCNDFQVCDACTAEGKTENCKKRKFEAICNFSSRVECELFYFLSLGDSGIACVSDHEPEMLYCGKRSTHCVTQRAVFAGEREKNMQ